MPTQMLSPSVPTTIRAHRVIIAAPADAASRLLIDGDVLSSASTAMPASASSSAAAARLHRARAALADLPSASLAIAQVVFDAPPAALLPVAAFGYLVPSSESADLLGVVFDSCAFPAQDAPLRRPVTRLSVMLAGGRPAAQLEQLAMDALRRHLHIAAVAPRLLRLVTLDRCLPQYATGHAGRVADLRACLPPSIALCGAALDGVGVGDCVASARAAVDDLRRRTVSV